MNADGSLESSNSQSSMPITVDGQAILVTIPAADAPTDGRVFWVNIYAAGATLNGAYRVGQVVSTVAALSGDSLFLYSAIGRSGHRNRLADANRQRRPSRGVGHDRAAFLAAFRVVDGTA